MRNDHKKQHPRKEQNRHQISSVSHTKKTQQEQQATSRSGPSRQSGQEKEIKGMDIDLMNYTDI
jgi:hypothetical protein